MRNKNTKSFCWSLFVIITSLSLAPSAPGAMADTAIPSSGVNELTAGATAIDESRYEDAIAVFSRALDSEALDGAGKALAHHHRGIAEQKLGQQKNAIADYGLAIKSGLLPKPVMARAFYNRAIAYADTGAPSEAEADYDACLALTPDFAAAYHNRANLRRHRGAYAEAISDYNEAMKRLSPKDQKLSLFGRALSREMLDDKAGAKTDLQAALAIDPAFKAAQAKLAALSAPATPVMAAAEPKVLPSAPPPKKSDVIRVASAGGWQTTAIRFENGTPIKLPPPASEKPLNTASLVPREATALQPAKVTKDGDIRIQLGAFRSEAIALQAWRDLVAKAPSELGNSTPHIERADLGAKGIYYRLQTGDYGSVAEAKSRCNALTAQSLACIVAAR
ncbi:MAG: hypothetical protein GC184_12505 [Rhizobiales bacterium]|nr:hypothetical protein [Hyphomicrobiales bacterium]